MKIEKLTEADTEKVLTKHNQYATITQRASSTANSSQVTDIKPAIKSPTRVNVYLNSKYSFSLDISQLADHPLKIGQILTEPELAEYRALSDFGKLYTRALEYTLTRPHSEKELRDYLRKKTTPGVVRVKNPQTGLYETKPKKHYPESLIQPVLDRLTQKGHLDDAKFATFLVSNYHTKKGISRRRLEQELQKKGISSQIIQQTLASTPRSDTTEITKIITKKRQKYQSDPQKLIQYLVRQGFDYQEAQTAVRETDSQNSAQTPPFSP